MSIPSAKSETANTLHSEPIRVRVAAILDTWFVSGPGRQLAALALALRERGVDLLIVMFQRNGRPTSPYVDYLTAQGLHPVVIPDGGPLDPEVLRRLASTLQGWSPAIVQTHGYRPTALVAALRPKHQTWRWVAFFHGDTRENWKVRAYQFLHHRLLPRADRLVVLSQVQKALFPTASNRVRLIHNASIPLPSRGIPVDLSPYREPGVALVGAVARLSPEKGLDILLCAVARLRAGGNPVTVVIAGDGPEQKNLIRLSDRLGLGGVVHFLGRVDNVTSLYCQLDVVVLSSRSGAEGLPNVLLEALRADVPVVATRVAAVPEVLAEPDSGIMVPPDSVEALGEGIWRAQQTGRSARARLARQAVTSAFSIDRRAQNHLDLYSELRPDCFGKR